MRAETMNNQPVSIIPFVLILMLIFIVVIPFLPLLISRDRGWWEAWFRDYGESCSY
jgi:hypothetical protein